MIAIDLSKQQALDADSKAIQQILLEILLNQIIQLCFSLQKKQKELFWMFYKEP